MQNQTNRKGIYNHTFVKNKQALEDFERISLGFGVVEVKYDKIDDGKEAQIFLKLYYRLLDKGMNFHSYKCPSCFILK